MPPRKKGYLFLECIPKKQKHKETQILVNFLRMFLGYGEDRIKRLRIKNKNQLLRLLNNPKYNNYSIIHISAHGFEGGFGTPKGVISFEDLVSRIGLKNRLLFFSSCGLGKEKNDEEFGNRQGTTQHVRCASLRDRRINNNKVERFHSTVREREKVLRGLETAETAQTLMKGFKHYYNFIRPHEALDGDTPAIRAGIELDLGQNKWERLIKKAAEHRVKNGAP